MKMLTSEEQVPSPGSVLLAPARDTAPDSASPRPSPGWPTWKSAFGTSGCSSPLLSSNTQINQTV